jgi:Na+/alanine symporter
MRAKLDAESLLKIILVLVVVWLVFQIVHEVLGVLSTIVPFSNLIGLIIVLLIALWLLDRI